MEKTCKNCLLTKPLTEFAKNKECALGHAARCKTCINKTQKEHWENNKELLAKKRSERRKNKIEQYRESERIRRKLYRDKNKDEVNRKYREYMRKYRKEKPLFRLQKYISYVVKYSLENRCSTHDIFSKLGYTVTDLMLHIEKQFKEGMSWDNYGEWHIDHITPQTWLPFSSIEDENFIKCWSLTNLQPLWAKENISKSNRYAGTPENPIVFLCDLDSSKK